MTEYQFNDLITDGDGNLWRYGGYGNWYVQTEDQDPWELDEIVRPHKAMVTIFKSTYEELQELAARYRGLCK